MTAEQKIKKITSELAGVHPFGMTQIELNIRDIVEEKKATTEEKRWAKKNTLILEFAED